MARQGPVGRAPWHGDGQPQRALPALTVSASRGNQRGSGPGSRGRGDTAGGKRGQEQEVWVPAALAAHGPMQAGGPWTARSQELRAGLSRDQLCSPLMRCPRSRCMLCSGGGFQPFSCPSPSSGASLLSALHTPASSDCLLFISHTQEIRKPGVVHSLGGEFCE